MGRRDIELGKFYGLRHAFIYSHRQSAPTPAFGAPTPASAPTPGGPGYGSTVYNAQTPAGMFANRADMPAETPAAYPPHERTGKTAFSKLGDVFTVTFPAYVSCFRTG